MTLIGKLKKVFNFKVQSKEILLSTDSFADNLILELRRAINVAVIEELEKYQDKYLSNILRGSHFPIEAISIIPCDHETARNVDDFFRIHADLDKNFERNFFTNNFPKEYRTSKGAKAILDPNISFSIQPSKLGIDNLTPDEEYQVNLRGNRKKFTSIVDIGKITADKIEDTSHPLLTKNSAFSSRKSTNSSAISEILSEGNYNQVISESDFPTSDLNKEISAKALPSLQTNSQTIVSIIIVDKNGERLINKFLPIMLGRSSNLDSESQYEKINIDSTYISRNQFVIFEVNGTVYGFVPKEAKLTAILGRRGTLRPLYLIEIDNQGLHMTIGQPLDSAITVVNSANPDLYPSVTIKLNNKNSNDNMTPVPNVRK
jgi:hypothetical protein